MLQKQLKRFFAGRFTEFGERTDVTADHRLQLAANRAKNRARPNSNTAHHTQALRDLEAVQRKSSSDHISTNSHRQHCIGNGRSSSGREQKLKGVGSTTTPSLLVM